INALMAASLAGASPVIGIDLKESRRDMARAFGATHVIDPAQGDVAGQIKAITAAGLDLAVEATVNPAVMAEAVGMTRQQGGRAVVIGNARHDAQFTMSPSVFNQGKSLLGTWGGDCVPDRDYARYGRLLASG